MARSKTYPYISPYPPKDKYPISQLNVYGVMKERDPVRFLSCDPTVKCYKAEMAKCVK